MSTGATTDGAGAGVRVWVCGANWLGDSIMSMPALQLYRRRHADAAVGLLVKPGLADLWSLHPDAARIATLGGGLGGVLRAARGLRRAAAGTAFVFPNSFRSALAPFLAAVPERVGQRGHARAWMLTRISSPPADERRRHQAWEYAALLGLPVGPGADAVDSLAGPVPGLPKLSFPEEKREAWRARLGARPGEAWAALLPGAARGPAKRWPAGRFAAVGRRLAADGCRAAVLGAPAEARLCGAVAEQIGAAAADLCGRTSLTDLAACLSLCRVAVTNDSGGMHLAAAAGAAVVAVFGLTDAARTGPLTARGTLVRAEGVQVSRDLKRNSAAATRALASIEAEPVCRAVRHWMAAS